jgi:predicted membrane protein
MENELKKPGRNPETSNRFLIGILLIIAGLILIVKKSSVLPEPLDYFIDDIIFSWQMLLIVIGVITLVGSDNKTPGIVLISVGGFFLIPELFTDFFRSFNFFWPALFIVVGVVLLMNSKKMVKKLDFSGSTGLTTLTTSISSAEPRDRSSPITSREARSLPSSEEVR